MFYQVPFIGRESELAYIDTLIHDKHTCQIVCIEAQGGFGKTRLLHEIYHRYIDENDGIFVTKAIDFDDRTLHVLDNIGLAMANKIGLEHFGNYIEALRDYRAMERGGVSTKRLIRERFDLARVWKNDFNHFTEKRRVVYLFDTIDVLKRSEISEYLLANLATKEVYNVLFLVSGRNAGAVWKTIEPMFGDNSHLIQLPPFDKTESETYLQKKQEALYVTIDSELEKKVLFLAGGRPILLDLTVEWLNRDVPFDWLLESTLEELQSLPKEDLVLKRTSFERQLVIEFAQMRRELDWYTLAMSYVYPMSVELAAELLDMSVYEVSVLQEQVQNTAYVKSLPTGEISLHDEMRRMLIEYVWPEIDPDEEQKRQYSKIAAIYYKNRIDELDKLINKDVSDEDGQIATFLKTEMYLSEREYVIQNRLRHALIANVDDGFSIYYRAVWKARNAKYYRFATLLEDTLRPFLSSLNEDQLYCFHMHHGRLLNDIGECNQARILFDQFLEDNRGNLEREADIHNALGIVDVQIGDLLSALEHQTTSLKLYEKLGLTKSIPLVANQIGYIHRLNGRWQLAIEYYKYAFDIALRIESRLGTIAGIMTNLAYVLSMKGRYAEAIGYGKQAIKIRQAQNNGILVGYSESALGSIYRDKGDYDEAEAYLNRAIARFEKAFHTENLALAYYHLGLVYFMRGTNPNNLHQLKTAQNYFEKSINLANKYHHVKEKPGTLLMLGYVYWELGQPEKARDMNEQAYHLSKTTHNIYQLVSSLVAKARYDHLEKKLDNVSFYVNEMVEYEKDGYRFPLFAGRMRRIIADIAFEQKQYMVAFLLYAEGLAFIAEHGGYGRYLLEHELNSLQKHIATLLPEDAESWYVYLKARWKKLSPSEKYATIVSWCDQQIVQIKLDILLG
ncbi:MAG: hypothetical protein B6242_08010 [Anaerolineaceae bacterium 4572_78]|nr:MAG: hypothetical protein B6242_08010 [Anaerolineaceae bacterium 4572_78]